MILLLGEMSVFVKGVRAYEWLPFVYDIAAAFRLALKTEEEVLAELADPEPERRSPSSCVATEVGSFALGARFVNN
jgi:hypothetical protein